MRFVETHRLVAPAMNLEPLLREYRPEDLGAIIDVYRDAVRRIAPSLYTPAQVDAWAAFAETGTPLEAMMAQGYRLVIESDAGIEAFAVLDPPDYVSLLYCRARASRRGYAKRLLQALETEAARRGIARVHTAASLISHPFFLRHGYAVDAPERVERNGVDFDRYRMSKRL
jgi:putative acetyltransferase